MCVTYVRMQEPTILHSYTKHTHTPTHPLLTDSLCTRTTLPTRCTGSSPTPCTRATAMRSCGCDTRSPRCRAPPRRCKWQWSNSSTSSTTDGYVLRSSPLPPPTPPFPGPTSLRRPLHHLLQKSLSVSSRRLTTGKWRRGRAGTLTRTHTHTKRRTRQLRCMQHALWTFHTTTQDTHDQRTNQRTQTSIITSIAQTLADLARRQPPVPEPRL